MDRLSCESLSLRRHDLTGSSSTARGCLVVYPKGTKSKQRVGVGDRTGVFRVFTVDKRLKCVPVFSTPVPETGGGSSSPDGGEPATGLKPVSRATLYADQLFVMRGSVLDAYSRKGTHYFRLDTNATETIHSLHIDTPFIFLSGGFMSTTFRETKELGYFLSPDRANSMAVYVAEAAMTLTERELSDYFVCLGCNDRTIRIVQSHQLVDEQSCEAAVTALYMDAAQRTLYYGTQAGSIGSFAVQSNNRLRRSGNLISTQRTSGVTCLSTYDINTDGMAELLVGFEDGTITIYTLGGACSVLPGAPRDTNEFLCVWTTNVGENVMSIAGGVIKGTQPDVIVHLFSGGVVAYTLSEGAPRRASTAIGDVSPADPLEDVSAKSRATQLEVEQLRQQIEQRTAELARVTGAAGTAAPLVAVASTFKADVTLKPIGQSPMLSIAIDADIPLQCAILQSTAAIQLLGTDTTLVAHQAVSAATHPHTRTLSLAKPVQDQHGTLGGKRLEVHLWADECHSATITLTLYGTLIPRTAQMKTLSLCALPLYHRVNNAEGYLSEEVAPFVLSSVTLRGAFAARDAHDWLVQLLPGTEEVYQTSSPNLTYVAEYIRSVLFVELSDGMATFRSDSLSALATVKRCWLRLASEQGMEMEEEQEYILYGSAARVLDNLQKRRKDCLQAQREALLLKGLQELQGSEADLACMPEKYKTILKQSDAISTAEAHQAGEMAFVTRALTSLYSCLARWKQHVPPLTPELQEQLEGTACNPHRTDADLAHFFFPADEHLHERQLLKAA